MAYLLERAERCTSLISEGFSNTGTAGPCIALHSSNPSKPRPAPEPEVETLVCLPLCQRKEKYPVTTDTKGRATIRAILFQCGKHTRLFGPSQ